MFSVITNRVGFKSIILLFTIYSICFYFIRHDKMMVFEFIISPAFVTWDSFKRTFPDQLFAYSGIQSIRGKQDKCLILSFEIFLNNNMVL